MINPIGCVKHSLVYGRWNSVSRAFYRIITHYAKPSDRMLEMGCSTAHISCRLSLAGYDISCLDIREEPVSVAKENFNKLGIVDSDFFVEDVFSHTASYDFIWNSGLIQCGDVDFQKKLVSHLSKLSRKVLLFYPDVGRTKQPNNNDTMLPGVGDAREFSVIDVPLFFYEHYTSVTVGVLKQNQIKMPFDMLWCYAEK